MNTCAFVQSFTPPPPSPAAAAAAGGVRAQLAAAQERAQAQEERAQAQQAQLEDMQRVLGRLLLAQSAPAPAAVAAAGASGGGAVDVAAGKRWGLWESVCVVLMWMGLFGVVEADGAPRC